MRYQRISVIGAGGWGTAIANLLADVGVEVQIWGRDEALTKKINSEHQNPKYLAQTNLNPKLRASSDLRSVLQWADTIVNSIPTQVIRKAYAGFEGLLKNKVIVNTSKGIEQETNFCVHEIFEQISKDSPYIVLSGPNFALEVAQRLPAATTLASFDLKCLNDLQKIFSGSYMRAYTSDDVVGVELGGALKNVIAIAAGITSGLKLGYNTQAALINRGVAEIVRMGVAKGAKAHTFFGLSGMGDLILTCTGPLSRNRKLGIAMGEGRDLKEAILHLGGVAEGYYTTKAAHDLSKKLKLEMPITEQIYEVLYEHKSPKQALSDLMSRELKSEWEFSVPN